MMKAVYPGTFDPITYGHLDLIVRASQLFDELIVAVGLNLAKETLFSIEERVEMARLATADIRQVRVDSFECTTVEYARSQGAGVIVRGMRTMSDFENEYQMAVTNKQLASDIETVLLISSFSHISSRLIKEIAALGGDLSPFVPSPVAEKLREKLLK